MSAVVKQPQEKKEGKKKPNPKPKPACFKEFSCTQNSQAPCLKPQADDPLVLIKVKESNRLD